MTIQEVQTFIVHPGVGKNWLFVKLTTDDGLVGWGECYTQADRDQSIETTARQLGRYLVGRDPREIKHFTHVAFRDWATKRGSMEFHCAVSGLEQAMWDLVGKSLGEPVYNLLGGPCRSRIRVYANGWGGGAMPDEIAERARATVALGFSALKFDPFPGPWQRHVNRDIEDRAVENVRAVREAVGPEVEILIEVHRRLAPMHAIRVAERMEEFRPFWYEEPVSSDNVDALAEVRSAVSLPVVTGEMLYTKAGFRQVFERQAADILNPDVCNCGGILELKEIAAMAEPYFLVVSPHNYNSMTIGLAASVQVAAAIPNFLILEYFVNFAEMSAEISPAPLLPVDGYIELPTAPGLGVELDEEAMRRHPYREFPLRRVLAPDEESL